MFMSRDKASHIPLWHVEPLLNVLDLSQLEIRPGMTSVIFFLLLLLFASQIISLKALNMGILKAIHLFHSMRRQEGCSQFFFF